MTICTMSSNDDICPLTSRSPLVVRTPKEIGLLIRDRRTTLGMTQANLAKQVGVARQWIVAIEQGKRRAELGLVLDVLWALGLLVDVRKARAGGPESEPSPIDLVLDRARRGDP